MFGGLFLGFAGAGIIVGGFALALYIVLSVFILDTHSIAFVRSLRSGRTTEIRRPGVHILWPLQTLVRFPFSMGSGAPRNLTQFPLRTLRIDPPVWNVVSKDGEEMGVDLWISLLVNNVNKFFFESFNGDVTGILQDMIRQKVVRVCKGMDAMDIRNGLEKQLDFSELETTFGVTLGVKIDAVQSSKAIRDQAGRDTQAVAARRAEHARAMADIEHAKQIEAGKAEAELARVRLAAEVERETIETQRMIDEKKHERAEAQARHEARMKMLQQEAEWADVAAAAKAGVTVPDYIRVQMAEAAREAAIGAKMVYLPSGVHPLMQME